MFIFLEMREEKGSFSCTVTNDLKSRLMLTIG